MATVRSILKRKLTTDNNGDDSMKFSSSAKRKHVKFRKPISTIKEFIYDSNELPATTPETNGNLLSSLKLLPSSPDTSGKHTNSSSSMDGCLRHQSINESSTSLNDEGENSVSGDNNIMRMLPPPPELTPIVPIKIEKKEKSNLQECINAFTFTELLQKCVDSGKEFPTESVSMLTSELSGQMQDDPIICSHVLEQLSELHSDEFLKIAINEHTGKEICDALPTSFVYSYTINTTKNRANTCTEILDQLNPDFILDYIFNQVQQHTTTNSNEIINNLLDKFTTLLQSSNGPDIDKNNVKKSAKKDKPKPSSPTSLNEDCEMFLTRILPKNLNDGQILDLIRKLTLNRRVKKN